MEKTQYVISVASELVDVEQHTLRYWEDELKLNIERSGLGHRLYSEEDISTFKKIKALKEQGFQLKAIKMVLADIDKLESLDPASLLKLKDAINEQVDKGEESMMDRRNEIVQNEKHEELELDKSPNARMEQFRRIMKDILADAVRENNAELSDVVSMNVTNSVIKEMDYLMRMKEEREEERFKKFDQQLREYQSGRAHAAASKEKKHGRKRLFKLT